MNWNRINAPVIWALETFGFGKTSINLYLPKLQKVLDQYNGRWYHNVEHLRYLLLYLEMCYYVNKNAVKKVSDLEFAEAILAVIYHDVVQGENAEQRSAEWFSIDFGATSLRLRHIQSICETIRETKSLGTRFNASNTVKLVHNADLAILAAQKTEYNLYCEKVYREYMITPPRIDVQAIYHVSEDFLRGRIKFLEDNIMQVGYYHDSAGTMLNAARFNMREEIRRLEGELRKRGKENEYYEKFEEGRTDVPPARTCSGLPDPFWERSS